MKADNLLFISWFTARGSEVQGKITTFVTSIADWQANSEEQHALFARYFEEQYPANSLIEITALAEPGLDVEIEAIAVLPAPA